MTPPIIGITMDSRDGPNGSAIAYHLNFDYAKAVEKAGGVPLAIPYRTDLSLIPRIVDALDGVLFTGGNDLDPTLYGQTWHPRAIKIDPARQTFELALMQEVERRRLPALAVCLGCQLLNVYRGGSLEQFIPDLPGKAEHRRTDPHKPSRRHAVRIEPGSALGRAIGKSEISANTYHKQAIKDVGRGLVVTAISDDGIVEGVEDPTMPLLAAVQWHPERLADEPEHLAPFVLLVNHAANGKEGRKVMTKSRT